MSKDLKRLTSFLIELGIEEVPHTGKTYLGHLVNVYRLMKSHGCTEELCRAGMFHSIYGTEKFSGFTLPLDRREEVSDLIGKRAERLAYLNCVMDRASFDRALEAATIPYRITERPNGKEVELSEPDFDDLARVHLFDWLEQVPRSRYGWDYRRAAYRRIATRLGSEAEQAYQQVFAKEPNAV